MSAAVISRRSIDACVPDIHDRSQWVVEICLRHSKHQFHPNDCEYYPLGKGGIRPFLRSVSCKTRGRREGWGEEDVPNESAEFQMCFGFVNRRLERAQFVNETPQGPDIGFRIVRLFLHEFGGHVVRCLPDCQYQLKTTMGGGGK